MPNIQFLADRVRSELQTHRKAVELFIRLRGFLAVDMRHPPSNEHRTVVVDGRLCRVFWAPGPLRPFCRRLTYAEFKKAYFGDLCQNELPVISSRSTCQFLPVARAVH